VAISYVADIPLASEIWQNWESAALFASAKGNFLQGSIIHVWPLIDDAGLLDRTLSMCRINWNASETQLVSMLFNNYSLEKDGVSVFHCAPKTVQCLVKCLIAGRLPHLVEQPELSAFLPAAEAQFDDLVFKIFGTGFSLRVVCSSIAKHLGDRQQALIYAKTEVISNFNPLKHILAQTALAVAQCIADEDEDHT
jgi:hypothetical protein